MKRKEKKFLAILIASLLLVLLFTPGEDRLEWAHTYMREDTRAYGSRILFEGLQSVFDGAPVIPIDIPPYEATQDTSVTGVSYVFLNDVFTPDDAELASLLRFVAKGNTLFVSAEMISQKLKTQFKLETDTYIPGVELLDTDTSRVNLVNPSLHQAGGYFYGTNTALTYLVPASGADTAQIDLLGVYHDGKPNYVRTRHKNGWIYLHTAPLAFTNYNMLVGEGAQYVFRALSYMTGGKIDHSNNAATASDAGLDAVQRIWWDAYYKPFRVEVRTPLRYILSAPALRTAYGIACIGLLLFVFFHGKRKQRPVPIVTPERNTTVEFAETVGQLYFHQGDHAALARKMIDQFRHYARSQLRMTTTAADELVPEIIAARSGVDLEKVIALLNDIKAIENGQAFDETRLQRLAKHFDGFYEHSAR